jgi:hypothetical protein
MIARAVPNQEESMPRVESDPAALAPAEHSRWRTLYRLGAVAALLSVVLIPLSVVAFFIWPTFPDNILDVIQDSWLGGLMSLDGGYLLANLLVLPWFLALYVTLREVDEGWALIALVMGLMGLLCLPLARPIPEMFAISERYATATSEAERAMYQATGEAMLNHFHGMAYHAHYVLGSLSLLISAILMLRSRVYSKTLAWVGIVTNVVVFGLYVPVVGTYLSLLSALGYLLWCILFGIKLYQLGWPKSTAHS